MNIEKMNNLMITAEDRAQACDFKDKEQGICEGIRMTMGKLGYEWYGRFRGGFRRAKKDGEER